jgi:hypothetical protein
MGSHCSFGHLKHKLWPKEGPGVELPGFRQFWLPTTKSQESTRNTWLQKMCDIPLKRSRRDLQPCFRRRVDRRSAPKVMQLQSCGSFENARFRDSHAGVPGVPGQNGHLDATPATSHRVYYKGEGGGFPKVRAVVSLVCPCCPWLVPTPKGSKMSSNHFVWFHAGPCEWVSLSILPSLSRDF